jgi:hypothetical protein
MASMNPLGGQVPGFDFLQGLMKSAGSALPGMNAWIAPTLDPEELAKRIEELRTVQFWLEQNAKMIGASIQALEVQRMTLSTLKNLNVQVGDIGEAMKIKTPFSSEPAKTPFPKSGATTGKTQRRPATSAQAKVPTGGTVDPMQWWGALTQQFSQLAAQAVKDSGADKLVQAARVMPGQALKATRAASPSATPKTKTTRPLSSRRKA